MNGSLDSKLVSGFRIKGVMVIDSENKEREKKHTHTLKKKITLLKRVSHINI